MLQNNFQVLPFYKDINEQHHRKPYAFGAIYPLYAPTYALLPFQLTIEPVNLEEQPLIKSAVLYTPSGDTIYDVTHSLNESLDTVTDDLGKAITIILPDASLVGLLKTEQAKPLDIEGSSSIVPVMYCPIKEGLAYLRLETGAGEVFFSEVMCLVSDISRYIKVQWYDNEDLLAGDTTLVYSHQLVNTVYINSIIGKPKYDFDEEGDERNGYFFAEKQLSKKTYKFSFVAPEYLCDAMRLVRLSDNIRISQNGQTHSCDSFNMSPEWEEQGDLASVEVEFTTDTVVKKIAAGWPK